MSEKEEAPRTIIVTITNRKAVKQSPTISKIAKSMKVLHNKLLGFTIKEKQLLHYEMASFLAMTIGELFVI